MVNFGGEDDDETSADDRLSRAIAALSIAGSDSGGGAGIQADLRVFAAHGLLGTTAITAVTAQNTRAVAGWEAVSPALVVAQIDAVLDDLPVRAAKTGMLASQAIIEAVIAAWSRWSGTRPELPLVIDPVMVATSGDRLLDEGAERAMRDLCALATVITPNRAEAAVLSGLALEAPAPEHAAAIAAFAPRATIVVKGGHTVHPTELAVDTVREPSGLGYELVAPWIDTTSTHGTGCTFSAAITAQLALREPLSAALMAAKRYLTGALVHALALGSGHGPVDHLHGLRAKTSSAAAASSSRRAERRHSRC